MPTYIAPLDLKYIFQNVLAGSPNIFMGLFFLAISVTSGLFKIQNQVFLLLIGLSSIILYGWFGGGFYLLTIIITGLVVFWTVKRIVST